MSNSNSLNYNCINKVNTDIHNDHERLKVNTKSPNKEGVRNTVTPVIKMNKSKTLDGFKLHVV